jgi:hypothetical protein
MPLAIGSKESEKLLSEATFQALQHFYFLELLKGNNHFIRLAYNEL